MLRTLWRTASGDVRAPFGDRDGMLWRLDFSNPDPLNWTMRLFFDAYSKQAFDILHRRPPP